MTEGLHRPLPFRLKGALFLARVNHWRNLLWILTSLSLPSLTLTMYLLFSRQDTTDKHSDPSHDGGGAGRGGGMSPVSIVMLVLFLLLLVAISYIVFSQLRARRLGLPAPTWRSYIPFLNNSRGSRSTRPSTGPLGWIKSKTTPSAGGFSIGGPTGYTGAAVRSQRTRAQFDQVRQDDEEAWDARGYREYEMDDDTEMQRGRIAPVTGGYDGTSVYGNSGLGPNDEEPQRGRSRSREPPYPSAAPAAAVAPLRQQRFSKPQPRSSMDSFTGVSVKGGKVSIDSERRSVFREAM